jgi:hypothetical protein
MFDLSIRLWPSGTAVLTAEGTPGWAWWGDPEELNLCAVGAEHGTVRYE